MPNRDQLIEAISAIHSAGLDEALWPRALTTTIGLCGGAGATLEIFDKAAQRHSAFFSVDVPMPAEKSYTEYWAARNPRAIYGLRQQAGDIASDYQILDEAAMDRNEFYSEMLPTAGFRYFVSTTPVNNDREFAALAIQRTRRQGHVEDAEIEVMRLLTPHIQQALAVAARLQGASRAVASFEQSLEWLDDGVALVRGDGHVASCNSAFTRMASCHDGIRIEKGGIRFSARGAQARLATAMASANRLRGGELGGAAISDFLVPRPSGAPSYIVSLRPLVGRSQHLPDAERAVATVFIRDPLVPRKAAVQLLREMFGLTAAEAALAHALQRGVSPMTYAREYGLSPNTVYTHLRRLKEKTGWRRTAELSRKLNELHVQR